MRWVRNTSRPEAFLTFETLAASSAMQVIFGKNAGKRMLKMPMTAEVQDIGF
jgi:hypothetical protein